MMQNGNSELIIQGEDCYHKLVGCVEEPNKANGSYSTVIMVSAALTCRSKIEMVYMEREVISVRPR